MEEMKIKEEEYLTGKFTPTCMEEIPRKRPLKVKSTCNKKQKGNKTPEKHAKKPKDAGQIVVISETDATPDLMTPDISDVFDSDLEAYLFDIPPLPSPIDSSNIINAQETCGSDPLLLDMQQKINKIEANQLFIINKLSVIETLITSSIRQDIVYHDDSILHLGDNNQLLSSCLPSVMLPHPSFTNPTTATTTVQTPCLPSEKPPTAMPPLPSSEINQAKLLNTDLVINKYAKLKGPSKAGALSVKLARESVFGTEILTKCTVRGCRELPALPTEELAFLKQVMFKQFPQFWQTPTDFEPIWTKCTEAINHACKALRVKGKDSSLCI